MEVGVDLTYLTYLVIIANEVKIVKEVINSSVLLVAMFEVVFVFVYCY